MRKTLALVALLSLSACVETTPVEVRPTQISTSQLNQAKATVVENFKDPGSAQFRNIKAYRVANGDTALCGEVNGKNSFGAYVGFKTFYIRFDGNTLKRRIVDDGQYAGTATYACREAATGTIAIATSELQQS